MNSFLRKNIVMLVTVLVMAVFLTAAAQGMEKKDFVITLLRGLAVGSITFLVASGFSLIFGLLDVLNLAHGTLFMIGAYMGWTVVVRPDTFVDLLTPLALIVSGFALGDVYPLLASRIRLGLSMKRILPWALILVSILLFGWILPRFPIAIWDVENYAQSPVTFSFMADSGARLPVMPAAFTEVTMPSAFIGLLLASIIGAFGISLFDNSPRTVRLSWKNFISIAIALIIAVVGVAFNDAMTTFLYGLSSNWLFFVAVLVATLSGVALGGVMEATLIRPLYSRPIYQLMLTLGMSAIGIEMVRAIWGRPEFVMPKPAFFNGTGGACPATNFADWWANNCSTILLLDGRVRVYNEIFIPIVGLVVLISIWILLQRTRLGMIIRAGVQDSQMVEALGINVRRVFTMVFALGVGLASLGGVLAAPSMGLSNLMGESLLLNALIALAIGGLTSYPGAALGSVIVGMIQQFIIKYGQIGIAIPFTEIIFKPTPPLVPASTVMLMVIILLLLPNGLLGKKE
ncbi:MAG: branched-chain amino acid ABC transporter permease [Chloroflexi bacterium]|nr:branched-chain amino acid ABC transporter permease [Chloroflexota bacterium]